MKLRERRRRGQIARVLTLIVCFGSFFSATVAGAFDVPKALPVGVIAVKKQAVTLTDNLPGRLESSKDAVVRARVTGIVEKRLFKEGTFVKQGELLFKIDDRSFRATLQSAKGALARAIAQKKLNEANVARYRALVKSNAVSRQVLDEAEATLATSNADIEIARAAVTQAEINLDYCSVTAPISGFIGRQKVTVGALVSDSEATEMAQIRQIDPLYVNVQQSATKILKLKDYMTKKSDKDDERPDMEVKIFLDDGTPYKYPGKLIFTDVAVDANTGEATVRASVPNPDHFLMPGLYVRVEVPQVTLENVFLVPQQAVTRNETGNSLFVAVADDKVPAQEGQPPLSLYMPKQVKITGAYGTDWIVTDGLSDGDKVIVDGMIKVNLLHVPHVIAVPWGVSPQQAQGAPDAAAKAGAAAPQQKAEK